MSADEKPDATADGENVREMKKKVREAVRPLQKHKWESQLAFNDKGKYLNVIPNILTILGNHPDWNKREKLTDGHGNEEQRIVSVIGFDDLNQAPCWLAPPPFSHVDSDPRTMDGQFKRGLAIQDLDMARIRGWFQRTYGFQPEKSDLESCVAIIAAKQRFHPVQEYLRSLLWDGKARVDSWLKDYCYALPDPERHFGSIVNAEAYMAKVGRYFLVQAVARAMEPGCMAKGVMILEGDQGIKKSTALRALMPDGDWLFEGHIDLTNKESFMALRGRWLIEFAEFYAVSRTDEKRVKHFISMRVDQYVDKYESRSGNTARGYVLSGTINPSEEAGYLRDTTGNERFWPVSCNPRAFGKYEIDVAGITEDRDQLWAEAYRIWLGAERCREEGALMVESAGSENVSPDMFCSAHDRCEKHRWWPNDKEKEAIFKIEQGARMEQHPWELHLRGWHDGLTTMERDDKFPMTMEVILSTVIGMPAERQSQQHKNKLGDVLKALRWDGRRIMKNGVKRMRHAPQSFWTRYDAKEAEARKQKEAAEAAALALKQSQAKFKSMAAAEEPDK